MRTLVFIYFILAITPALKAQHVHTKTTWAYGEEDTVGYIINEVVYNTKGEVLRNEQFAVDPRREKKLIISTYDTLGRLSTISYSDDSRTGKCTFVYMKDQKIKTCTWQSEDQTWLDIENNRYANDSLVVSDRLEHWQVANGDTLLINVNSTTYAYNENGQLVSRASYDTNNVMLHWLKYTYFPGGRIETMRQGFGANNYCQDSTSCRYDDYGRLTHIHRFEFRRSNGYAVATRITIEYDEHLVADSSGLNTKIIHAELPYTKAMGDEFYPDPNPTSISVVIIDADGEKDERNTDITYYYNYNEHHKLTSISGTGFEPRDQNVDADVEILYYENDKAIVNYYGTNYTGARIPGRTETYVKDELVEWSYNTEWGFPFHTTRNVYTYYK